MEDKLSPIQHLIDALNFYSNPDHYWSDPLDLNIKRCHETLKEVREADKSNKILQDRGKVAWDALMKFDEEIHAQKALNEL